MAKPCSADADDTEARAFCIAAAARALAAAVPRPLADTPSPVPTILLHVRDRATALAASHLTRLPDHRVLVVAADARAADSVPYAAALVPHAEWASVPHDVLVLPALHPAVSESAAAALTAKFVLPTSSPPVSTPSAAQKTLVQRGVFVAPPSVFPPVHTVVNAIRQLSPPSLQHTHPLHLYAFLAKHVHALVQQSLTPRDDTVLANPKSPPTSSYDDAAVTRLADSFAASVRDNMASAVDAAIIGAGVAGTACAYYLSQEPEFGTVALFEQGATVPSLSGSSCGDSRFYREMYSDPFYARLMSKSLALWRDLQREAEQTLLEANGVLFFGSSDSGETAEGSIPGCRRTMDDLGMPYDFYDSQHALNARFAGLCAQPGDVGLLSLNDGSINASASCDAMARGAVARGARVVPDATLLNVVQCPAAADADAPRFLLHFADGAVVPVRKKLVLTTGAWTSRILREQFDVRVDAKVDMVAWGHFELPDDAPDPPQWFAFRKRTQTGLPMPDDHHGLYYGFPSVPAPPGSRTRRMVKVGTDFTPDSNDCSAAQLNISNRAVTEALRKDIEAFLRVHWPAFGEMIDLQLSPYHMTPSQDFVLGQVPSLPNVVTFCGASGRAFKFGPMLGACLADVVVGREPRVDISRFDPGRVISAKQEHAGRQRGGGEEDDKGDMLGKSHVPFGEQGAGVYSLATQGCFDVIKTASSLSMKAIDTIVSSAKLNNPGTGPIVLADFGAADGGTSLNLWTDLIAHVHSQEPRLEIDLRYEDQPNADFQSLFAHTQGRLRIPGRTGATFLEGPHGDKVFVSAIGTTFHQQCLPSSTLHFGLSATAMHWLSGEPELPLPRGVVHHTGARSGAIGVAWAKQAAKDWETILVARSNELVVGGRLVIANFCIDDKGQFLGSTERTPRSMYKEMERQWSKMLEAGRISEQEFRGAMVVNYYRTTEEMCAPLREGSGSQAYANGLRVEHISTAVTACPYRQQWLDGVEKDRKAHSKRLVMTMRTWSNSSFESALDEARADAEKKAICNELYDGIAAAVELHPDDYGMDYVHAFMVINKV